NGGNGFLRLLTFDLDAGRVEVQTWSPTLKRNLRRFDTGGDGAFTVKLNPKSPIVAIRRAGGEHDAIHGSSGTPTTQAESGVHPGRPVAAAMSSSHGTLLAGLTRGDHPSFANEDGIVSQVGDERFDELGDGMPAVTSGRTSPRRRFPRRSAEH
ncbi:MAG: hypothetical protein PHU85_14040, partial [Phycisphaerae bacterium]|nr:hypothetical protein [Phycisphaerae bacterium]